MIGLLVLLKDHGEAIEADLLREYGVDLLDLWRGRLSLRRVKVLVAGLSQDARLRREVSGPDADWNLTAHLLALAVDYLAIMVWQKSNAGVKSPSPLPKPIPRPGQAQAEARRPMTVAQRDRLLALAPPKTDA